MPGSHSILSGQTVRLSMPYLEADRGIYTVVYVYNNGWLGVLSHSNGRSYDVPAFVCRPIETKADDDNQAAGGRK